MSVAELIEVPQPAEEVCGDLAIMLTGGGARAAYQVGLLRGMARHFPHLRFEIITGVSAGAINAMFLAARPGSFAQQVEELTELWCALECGDVFLPNYARLIPFRTALHALFPGGSLAGRMACSMPNRWRDCCARSSTLRSRVVRSAEFVNDSPREF